MANYNFDLAKEIIEASENLVEVSLGMKEDWFSTADTIWDKDGFKECFYNKVVCGIGGSFWATPVLRLDFEDGSEKWYECYEGNITDQTTRDINQNIWSTGVLSQKVQEHISKQEIIPLKND